MNILQIKIKSIIIPTMYLFCQDVMAATAALALPEAQDATEKMVAMDPTDAQVPLAPLELTDKMDVMAQTA